MEIQTAVRVDNTEQKVQCSSEIHIVYFLRIIISFICKAKGGLHCKLHLTDEQHSVYAFTPPASCLALHYQQWGEKQHFLLHYPCYSLFTYQLFWNVALI